MKALQKYKLPLPWQDFKCYKVIKKKENILIQPGKKALQFKVNKKAQGAAAGPMCAEHMQFVCWMWLDITNGFLEVGWGLLRLGRTITSISLTLCDTEALNLASGLISVYWLIDVFLIITNHRSDCYTCSYNKQTPVSCTE